MRLRKTSLATLLKHSFIRPGSLAGKLSRNPNHETSQRPVHFAYTDDDFDNNLNGAWEKKRKKKSPLKQQELPCSTSRMYPVFQLKPIKITQTNKMYQVVWLKPHKTNKCTRFFTRNPHKLTKCIRLFG